MRQDDETLAALARVARAKERLKRQANPEPVKTPERRTVAETDVHVGAGRDRTKEPQRRALTTAERMYRDGSITYEEWQAAGVLRNRYMAEIGSNSEGVGSYGDPKGSDDGWRKADLKAQAILRKNRTSTRELAELMFACVGSYDEEGNKTYDHELAVFLIRSVIETVDPITLTYVGKHRTLYTGIKNTQAAGGGILKELYRKAAAHLRYVRAREWRDSRWRVVDV